MDKTTPRLAIPVFRARVAPVLNWCSRIHLFPEGASEKEANREVVLLNMSAFDRLKVLQAEGVCTLICGALSPDLFRYASSIGLHIIHGIAGEIDEVLRAYRSDELDQPRFWLPGCRGPRCCGKGLGKGRARGPDPMTFVSTGPKARHRANFLGAPGEATGGTPGHAASDPEGTCVCEKCGTVVRMERGTPCPHLTCPVCAQPMSSR